MKKDDALALRERLRAAATQTAAKLGFPALADDGKLYHDEVGEEARWAQRLALTGRWPHLPAGEGPTACPGLRLEVWYFPGKAKEEEIALLAICEGEQGLAPLRDHLEKTAFKELLTGGRYAKRYKALEPLARKLYPTAAGAGRRAPVAKAEAALIQLLEDAIKPIDQALTAFDPAGEALSRFQAECAAFDPLAALKARFGK